MRTIAAETAISPTSVHRYFKLLGLQPHRNESFKLSTDQFFIEKLRDVVGLGSDVMDDSRPSGFGICQSGEVVTSTAKERSS